MFPALVVIVVLLARLLAVLLVATGLAPFLAIRRGRRRQGDDAAAVLAALDFGSRRYEPVELQVHGPDEVAESPRGTKAVRSKQCALMKMWQGGRQGQLVVYGWVGEAGQSVLDYMPNAHKGFIDHQVRH